MNEQATTTKLNREKVIVSWSGGKDSALALYEVYREYDVVALLTTVTEEYDRISMHGVRTALLEQQAEALGFPVEKVFIPPVCRNEEYETRTRSALEKYQALGVTSVVCGDLFLEDVRRYREERLFTMGMSGLFPLWHKDTSELARRFIALGFRAALCCIDTHALDPCFAGREYDHQLLGELPPGVDPCGENGEFHSFVFDGPIFGRPIPYRTGERVLRDDRYFYCDLLPDFSESRT